MACKPQYRATWYTDREWEYKFVTVLVTEADKRFRAGWAIINSNDRTMFRVLAAYCWSVATHSNSNWANFGPNERTAEWAAYLALCLCTLCLVYTVAVSCSLSLSLLLWVRLILEQLRPNTFACFHHLIMSWLFHNPLKYCANRSAPQIHCLHYLSRGKRTAEGAMWGARAFPRFM